VSELKYKEVSIEQMWKVIEDFGINRAKFERTNPSDETIKSVYLAIKGEK
jgi:hypothetical protein